jgi:hypothetical protein
MIGIYLEVTSTFPRRVIAEFAGTAFWVAAVIGSGLAPQITN